MGIIYQLSYLEAFNHDFFRELFYSEPQGIISKSFRSKKDQEKLVMSFREIIEEDYAPNNKVILLVKMAEKMYSEIFDYGAMPFPEFIKKLLDSFLELNFTKSAQEKNLNFEKIQDFRDYRNEIVHRKSEKKEVQDKEFYNLELTELLINYINLIKELVISKFYKETSMRIDL